MTMPGDSSSGPLPAGADSLSPVSADSSTLNSLGKSPGLVVVTAAAPAR